jgi:hypothetical protein
LRQSDQDRRFDDPETSGRVADDPNKRRHYEDDEHRREADGGAGWQQHVHRKRGQQTVERADPDL